MADSTLNGVSGRLKNLAKESNLDDSDPEYR
jgi:hypothetical protein